MKPSTNLQLFIDRFTIGNGCILFCLGLILVSCAALPKIQSSRSSLSDGDDIRCELPFVKNRWQFVHSIKAVLPNGQRQSMIGTIIVTPETQTIQGVLMSIEGIVLLDVLYDQTLIVNRAIPPFDQPEIYQGLIDDIRLLFLKPDGNRIACGQAGEGAAICRYRKQDGMTVDVTVGLDGKWKIDQYSRNDRLERTVRADFFRNPDLGKSGEGIPARLELTAHGFLGYKLSLDLIEAVPLTPQGLSE